MLTVIRSERENCAATMRRIRASQETTLREAVVLAKSVRTSHSSFRAGSPEDGHLTLLTRASHSTDEETAVDDNKRRWQESYEELVAVKQRKRLLRKATSMFNISRNDVGEQQSADSVRPAERQRATSESPEQAAAFRWLLDAEACDTRRRYLDDADSEGCAGSHPGRSALPLMSANEPPHQTQTAPMTPHPPQGARRSSSSPRRYKLPNGYPPSLQETPQLLPVNHCTTGPSTPILTPMPPGGKPPRLILSQSSPMLLPSATAMYAAAPSAAYPPSLQVGAAKPGERLQRKLSFHGAEGVDSFKAITASLQSPPTAIGRMGSLANLRV